MRFKHTFTLTSISDATISCHVNACRHMLIQLVSRRRSFSLLQFIMYNLFRVLISSDHQLVLYQGSIDADTHLNGPLNVNMSLQMFWPQLREDYAYRGVSMGIVTDFQSMSVQKRSWIPLHVITSSQTCVTWNLAPTPKPENLLHERERLPFDWNHSYCYLVFILHGTSITF